MVYDHRQRGSSGDLFCIQIDVVEKTFLKSMLKPGQFLAARTISITVSPVISRPTIRTLRDQVFLNLKIGGTAKYLLRLRITTQLSYARTSEIHTLLVGTVTPEAAEMCGLVAGTKVICGGVDNSCMALGTTGIGNGRVYTSLGSSAWIAVTATNPSLILIICHSFLPTSKKGITHPLYRYFPRGTAYRWARDTFCAGFNRKLSLNK